MPETCPRVSRALRLCYADLSLLSCSSYAARVSATAPVKANTFTMPSWLASLSSHPIFELPDSPATASPTRSGPGPHPHHDRTSALGQHNSTFTPLARASSSSSRSPLFANVSTSPRTGRNGSTPTRSSSASSSVNALASARSKKPQVGGLGRQSKMVVVARRDLIVAVGTELRITSLNQAKARMQHERPHANETDHDRGEYKVLHTPLINFEIQQLVLNPTNTFLAVVGAHSIAVVVLPRKGSSSIVGSTVECRASSTMQADLITSIFTRRSLLVGHYYHGLSGSPLVSQILWHPWGANSSSLLVLTIDSTIREYDISTDVEEPTQTLSFIEHQPQQTSRSTPTKRSGAPRGFSAEDRNAKKAVAMCLGGGQADWGPLTLFGLMRNGDVVAICPFLPKKASVPASYIHALSSFVSTKVDYLNVTEATSDSMALTLTSSTPTKSAAAPHLSSLYARQLQYVHQLVRQASRAGASSSNLESEGMDIDPTIQDSLKDHLVHLTAPRFGAGNAIPKVQGPFLLQPEPIELDHGEDCELDSLATDLLYLYYEPQDRMRVGDKEVKIGLGVVGIAYLDGKVDLCLEVEKVEARWEEGSAELRGEEEEKDALDELPSLCVYETIDLGLVRELDEQQARASMTLEGGWVSFIKDPLYVDTIYLQHPLGSHCIVLSRWLDDLVDTLNPRLETGQEDEEKQAHEMNKAVRASEPSQVVWIVKTVNPIAASDDSTTADATTPLSVPVVGMDLINDVYLGYTMLLVTSSLQLVAIELSLRVDSSLLPSTTLSSSTHRGKGLSNEPPPYLSLLETPFKTPSILTSSSQHVLPRQVVPKSLANKGALETVTPDSLRFIAKSVEALRTRLSDLVDASDQVQNRIELQLAELGRQLTKVHELRKIIAGGLIQETSLNAGDEERVLKDRIGKAKERQEALLKRTDRILQGLMDRHAPSVSTFERKWFDELKRLEGEIEGGKEGDGPGLTTRVERLVEKVEMLKPGLEEMKKKKTEGPSGAGNLVLGGTQLHKVEEKLAEEAELIMEARRKVEKLSQALGALSMA
ncbi:BZ3500_MvSof-1268-A1-R1_Chr5-3g08179 [Microbotryum saponariae]|uniref:BZ3500_MvSof-1268-A1-R1_Chr5-3g08179 protein n=1 Tax=Microbotryum saponariae TaxID=289078 RepID=A0A2X0LR52_9BASI|nr:BZ3500_MvSof-1268-A1-R1_Chr5-3g08179 [Microbotryum saponariae]SDA07938.1 BZ3501_MvSof-1269-A2-R1_Chr5-1g07323 [Microbotryum saponariae]